ncbi:MAG TPA: phosphoribosyl-ATP diphosphatase [Lacipirellulaceae bacterium]|jgi:phosphoribosyl-ATP pyrophosphohydrolase|nr:phosphoribosyl-ATP diphosphatase [Lacipirellulaceae bacterium]
MSSASPLEKLERTIAARATKPNEKSYTSQLLAGGLSKIGAKITEEAGEVVEAAGEAGDAGREHFIREVGDLVYHLLVLMEHRKCTLADLENELSRRFGVSGLAEKASRKLNTPAEAASPKVAVTAKPAASLKRATPTAKTRKPGKKTPDKPKAKAKVKSKTKR